MTDSMALPDQLARDRALDISTSFVVQAPAGSGKTELLTLRYMALLSVCEQPEEVLAITFTRKAASEMRDRIVGSLRWARDLLDRGVSPEQDFERQRLKIAGAVLERNEELAWRLLENPSRLRVQTIDSFCFYLASQLPILSRIGGNPAVSEDVSHCFIDAINNTLAELDGDSAIAEDIALLLEHLDNNLARVEKLLSGLLYSRDQWLGYVVGLGAEPGAARHYLQQSLAELIGETLTEARTALYPYQQELVTLFNYSTSNLIAEQRIEFADFTELTALPAASPESLRYWQRLSEMLLTGKNELRSERGLNVKYGFPAGKAGDAENKARCKEYKQRFGRLRDSLMEDIDSLNLLAELRLLPELPLPEHSWRFLAALLNVLARLSAQLLISFRKFRLIDYAQTSAAARDALGSPDQPTDIALALDHRIQHILVDEFQDTSRLQLNLLQQLTAGWEPEDGRSLFLVGDAMQSCYGFRNANVGIFLEVREHGINAVSPETLTLSANFRSQARVVNWVNRHFAEAFPQQPNSARGAVPYSHSVPIKAELPERNILTTLIAYPEGQRQSAREFEADLALEEILRLREQDPQASIAVLVRSRSHFAAIIPRLRQAGLNWQATDVDRLASLPVIEDLLSLTRALLNPADRLSWLAILRAPWCGLDSSDLLAVARATDAGIWPLPGSEQLPDISADGAARIDALRPALNHALSQVYRRPLREVVEMCWSLLGGAQCCGSEAERDSVAQYFQLLETHASAYGLSNLQEFQEIVAAAYVAPSHTLAEDEPGLHLLTMHKAKGLEYDHVILPGLSQITGRDDKPLLQWFERVNGAGELRLFLSALTATGSDDDALYRLLRHEQQQKNLLENTRLLYIAVTRARRSARLLAVLQQREADQDGKQLEPRSGLESELMPPPANSLLSRIWDVLGHYQDEVQILPLPVTADSTGSDAAAALTPTTIRRFTRELQLPATLRQLLDAQQRELLTLAEETKSEETKAAEAQEDTVAALIGTLVHRALEHYVGLADRQQFIARLPGMRRYWHMSLSRLLNEESAVGAAVSRIEAAIDNSLDSSHGWIFEAGLEASVSELPLSQATPVGPREFVVDRSFVDAEGVRWIIDYKTSAPRSGESESDFIARQRALYRDQLQRYANLFRQMEDRPIRAALFLTDSAELIEVSLD